MEVRTRLCDHFAFLAMVAPIYAFLTVLILHASVHTDKWVKTPLSDYHWMLDRGSLMSTVFVAFAIATWSLAGALLSRHPVGKAQLFNSPSNSDKIAAWSRLAISLLLAFAGVGIAIAGIFPTGLSTYASAEKIRPEHQREIIDAYVTWHRNGAAIGFGLGVVAAMLLSLPMANGIRKSSHGWSGRQIAAMTLAVLSLVFGVLYILAINDPMGNKGLWQRATALSLAAWLVIVSSGIFVHVDDTEQSGPHGQEGSSPERIL